MTGLYILRFLLVFGYMRYLLSFSFLFWPILILLLVSVRQVNQYERGVKFMFGKFYKMVDPGWRIILPVVQSMTKVDIRTKAVEVPYQDAITKDNVSCKINAVIYYRIVDVSKSIIEVENVWNAASQLAQTTMRNVAGELTLDELLSERDQASERIRELVSSHSGAWGVEVQGVELKDIQLPEDMQRTIAKQAEAERERRAVIINSEGEVAAAEKGDNRVDRVGTMEQIELGVEGVPEMKLYHDLTGLELRGEAAETGFVLIPRFRSLEPMRGYRLRLLSAAFRNHMHWSEFIGGDVVISPPYKWQVRFNASDIPVESRIDTPVDPKIVSELMRFEDFRRAYAEDGMSAAEFDAFPPTRRTLRQFIAACYELNGMIRDIMIPNPDKG